MLIVLQAIQGPSRELLNGATARPSNELGSSCFGLQIINNYKIRNRTLQNTGKCEGAKQHYRGEESDMIKIIKKLRNQDKWSFRRISKYMNIEYGMVNQNDNALHASQVKRIVEYKSIWR